MAMKRLEQENRIDARPLPAFWRLQMFSEFRMLNGKRQASLWIMLAMLLFLAAPFAAQAASANPPVAIVTPNGTVSVTGLPSGMMGSVAFDACNNMYMIQGTNNGAVAGGSIYQIPFGGGAATKVWTGTGDNANWDGNFQLVINSAKTELVFANGAFWQGQYVAQMPIVNCALQTSNFSSLPGSGWDYASGLATDAAGNIYIGDGSKLIEANTTGGALSATTNQIQLLSGLSDNITSIVFDLSGNLYFTVNNDAHVYQLAYTSGTFASTATVLAGGFANPAGLTIDAAGNLYVADGGNSWNDNSVIYLIPNEGPAGTSALNAAHQIKLFTSFTGYSWGAATPLSAPVALDNFGNIYATVQGTVNEWRFASSNLGSVAVGSSANSTSSTAIFYSTETPATINVVPASGAFTNASSSSCVAATQYTAGSTCTINIAFAPAMPGIAYGSVVFSDANGVAQAVVELSGVGIGAGLTADPGALSTVGSGFTAPAGAAVDNQGNRFFADSGSNAVMEIPAGATAPVSLGIGLKAPTGVAVDGAGNVYVADTGNNQIVEIPIVNGALSKAAQTTVISSSASIAGESLSQPDGIAVDSLGNLYIADSGNKRVVYLPYVGSLDVSLAAVLGNGMSSPSAITVDASGNVYVADAGNGNVYELTAPISAGVQVTVASGYSSPSGLAVDASGALFVVDQGNQKVWRIPNLSGTLTTTSALNVTGQLDAAGTPIVADPYGVALDANGNAYVTDSMNAKVYELARTNASQSTGTWSPGTVSDVAAFIVENAGNSALTFLSPYETASGDTTQFNLLSGEAGACADGGSVAAGSSCNVEATFAPAADGNYTYTLALSSNATNSTTSPTIAFTGIAATTAATQTVLTQTAPSGPPAYDDAVTFSVTVSSVVSANGTPAGSVSLLVDGITKQTAPLSNGMISFTLSSGFLSGGGHSIAAKYVGGVSGFITYSASTSPALTINVTPVASVTTLSYATTYVQPASQNAGTSVLFTATVASTFAGTPTGTVTFTITDTGGNSSTQGVALTTASGGQVSYTYQLVAPAAGVTYDVATVTATYSGDTNFSGSASASSSFDVTGPQGSAVASASSLSLTTSLATPGSLTFTAMSYGGFNGVVGFQCNPTTLPANSTCVFSPGQVVLTPSTPGVTYPAPTVTLTLAINQAPQTPTASKMIWWLALPTGLLLLFARRRIKAVAHAGCWNMLLLVAAIGALSACIVGSTGCNNSTTAFTTPAGSSTVTVTAYADPYKGSPSNNVTMPCTTGANNPCTQQSFNVNVTVQ
jgi:sugar lactone lactonase YvrE